MPSSEPLCEPLALQIAECAAMALVEDPPEQEVSAFVPASMSDC